MAMNTKELIQQLRDSDPTGEMDVVIHTDCAVEYAETVMPPSYVPKVNQRKPHIRLAIDCLCGYVP